MGIYWIPESREEQIDAIQKMLDLDFVEDKDREILKKLKQNLIEARFLLDEERKVFEQIIEKYGAFIE